jgi:D-alanyl-D-alanine carboxypeptidase
MRIRRRVLAHALLLLAPLSPLAAQAARGAEQRLRDALTRIVADQHLPGATAAISIDGRVVTTAVGLSDSAKHIAMRPTHRMLVGSATKPFFDFVVLSAAAEGRLDLDAPVSRWLGAEPWFSRLPNASALTMRQLLAHRGGLPNHAGDSAFAFMVRHADAARRRAGFSPVEQIAVILDRPATSEVGAAFGYSDTGYLVAALALERAIGSTYYSELERRVLRPLGLHDTSPSDHDDLPRLSQGYNPPPTGAARGFATWGLPGTMVHDGRLAINPKFEWTGGGLVSTSRDLALWMEALFERDPWKQRGDEMIRGRVPDAPDALGIFVSTTADGPLYWHPGGFPGYHTEVAYSPALGVGIAFQTNCSCPTVNGASAIHLLLEAARALAHR